MPLPLGFGKPHEARINPGAGKRPKHTTLEDFEELYFRVDDYVWYQVQLSKHVKEVRSRMGLEFLRKSNGYSRAKRSPAFDAAPVPGTAAGATLLRLGERLRIPEVGH
jgi:hypothetical protein